MVVARAVRPRMVSSFCVAAGKSDPHVMDLSTGFSLALLIEPLWQQSERSEHLVPDHHSDRGRDTPSARPMAVTPGW